MHMMTISSEIEAHLPFLRRYARAMTGSRTQGDRLAEAVLVSVLSDLDAVREADTKIVIFQRLQDMRGPYPAILDDLTELEARAQMHLARLTPGSRDALLLSALERFSETEISQIMRTPVSEVCELLRVARSDISKSIAGRVLVIEDELAIAEEIQTIVGDMGHSVIGSAPTKRDALRIVEQDEPDLILSDIQLADDTSGLDAVAEILSSFPKKPVIYITGFPEKLLTGIGQEPAFLITKPYSVDQVRSAVSQAMFFSPRVLS